MSSSSNRAPSPLGSRPRNLQEREGIPSRKSFNGYPLAKPSLNSHTRSVFSSTPANSPADCPRRNSFERDHEQKENERDHNSTPVPNHRSPSPSVLKGTKHFMSPTISAASKINPSPRKKVLGERNEAIRTSASLLDGKFHFFSTSSLDFADENGPKDSMEHPALPMKNEVSATHCEDHVSHLSPQVRNIELEPDIVVLSPEMPMNVVKSSEPLPISEMPKTVGIEGLEVKTASLSSPIIAPLDADPSFRPYDPKTNYLSPRPQFLHYRPNPRIETYINHGMRLDAEFASEASSENESSEQTFTDESQKEQDESVSSSCSSASVETSPAEEMAPSMELNQTETPQVEVVVDSEKKPAPRFFSKWKVAALLLVFLVGSMSISAVYSPRFGAAINRDQMVSKVYNDVYYAASLAKENLNGLVQETKLWSDHAMVYLVQIAHNWEAKKQIPVQYANLTGWEEDENEDYVVEDFQVTSYFYRKEDRLGAELQKNAEIINDIQSNPKPQDDSFAEKRYSDQSDSSESDAEKSEVLYWEYVSECQLADLVDESENKVAEHEPDETNSIITVAQEDDDAISPELEKADLFDEPENKLEPEEIIAQDETDGISSELQTLEETVSIAPAETENDVQAGTESSISSLQVSDEQPQVSPPSEPVTRVDQNSFGDIQTAEEQEEFDLLTESVVTELTAADSELMQASDRRLAPNATTVGLTVAALLLAAMALMYKMKSKKGNVTTNSAPMTDQVTAKERPLPTPAPSALQPSFHLSPCPSSWSGPVEVDMIGASCPSEMSSYQSKRQLKEGDEAQSVEKGSKRKHKRESLAASSEYTKTSSYGSFTTYSIVHSKHADEEMVTPVRRSSRIMKQVTSP